MLSPNWIRYPQLVNQIRERIPEPHASRILNLRLEVLDIESCYPYDGSIICSPDLLTIEVIAHEYGHIIGERHISGHPDDWEWTYRRITGVNYIGAGVDMLAEGFAEAVSRTLLNTWLPEEAKEQILEILSSF